MWRILQADQPDTFVLATNRTETVRDFVTMAFRGANLDVEWKGTGDQETGHCARTGKVLVRVSPKFYRPAEVDLLIGDASKAERELGWKAETSLEQLCQMMVDADLRRNEAGFSF
jgi:GDPmannose 4,6-dehydratase